MARDSEASVDAAPFDPNATSEIDRLDRRAKRGRAYVAVYGLVVVALSARALLRAFLLQDEFPVAVSVVFVLNTLVVIGLYQGLQSIRGIVVLLCGLGVLTAFLPIILASGEVGEGVVATVVLRATFSLCGVLLLTVVPSVRAHFLVGPRRGNRHTTGSDTFS